nr:LysM peptidoglycan-binding domain-containing protein [Muribaculaceae bacterium]
LHDIYGDWSLAIAAYNCGPGNVNKALRRAQAAVPSLPDGTAPADTAKRDFWAIYPYLPKETRGYLPCFIAATYVMNHYDKHNISPALAKRPILTDSVHVRKRIHFQQIADVLNIPVEELKILNPQYRQQIIPGDIKEYPLVLPAHQVYAFIMNEDAIAGHNTSLYARRDAVEPAGEAPAGAVAGKDGDWVISEKVQYHKVRKGETMASIAKKYGVSLRSLRNANGGVRKPARGARLKVVTTQRVWQPRPQEAPAATTPPEGDDLLVAAPDTSASDTAAADTAAYPSSDQSDQSDQSDPSDSPDSDSTLSLGSVVGASAQPAAETPKAAAPAKKQQPKAAPAKKTAKKETKPATYTVRNGDTLWTIAKKNGTTVQALQKANGLAKNAKIKPGQKLRLK